MSYIDAGGRWLQRQPEWLQNTVRVAGTGVIVSAAALALWAAGNRVKSIRHDSYLDAVRQAVTNAPRLYLSLPESFATPDALGELAANELRSQQLGDTGGLEEALRIFLAGVSIGPLDNRPKSEAPNGYVEVEWLDLNGDALMGGYTADQLQRGMFLPTKGFYHDLR